MQHEDACTCKAGTTARCNAPWRWPNLAVQREDEAPARLARQRGVRHRGGGQTLRCSATIRALARLARQRGARHRGGGQPLRCSATIHATSRLARLRGTRHCACGNLVAQREDACTCKTSRTARCKVPCLRRILRCSATMRALARVVRQCGARHRGGGQTLRYSATIHATSRLARLRGARHCACGNLVAQCEDACIARRPGLRGARCRACEKSCDAARRCLNL